MLLVHLKMILKFPSHTQKSTKYIIATKYEFFNRGDLVTYNYYANYFCTLHFSIPTESTTGSLETKTAYRFYPASYEFFELFAKNLQFRFPHTFSYTLTYCFSFCGGTFSSGKFT